MTFLQPFILYGLPLILLPVLIHLLNRLRYRTQKWAAMRFLLSAQKQSIRRSRLRQWIVLLMRMLAVLAIILFLARPMTGGWSGFFSSGEPEIILLALDRSASMETLLPNGETRRERVLRSFAEAASVREGSTVVLVENVYRDPQPLASAADLLNPDMERYVGPTDTTADVPALLTTALDWLEENEVGSAEVWIASDLRANDWIPDGAEPRWKRLTERLAKVGEKYAMRLVNYDVETGENARLRCKEVIRSKNLLRCQRGSQLPDGAPEVERTSYRVTYPKALTPEQLLSALLRATGNTEQAKALEVDPDAEKFDRKGYFTGTNLELPPSLEEIRAIFAQTYGQPAGEAEVDFVPGMNKSLFLMNDRLIRHWLTPREGNLVDRLGKLETPEAIARELYLSVLSRLPVEEERGTITDYLSKNEQRKEAALGDLAWALLNSAEFRFNH